MSRFNACACFVLFGLAFPLHAAEMQIPIDVSIVGQQVEITGYLDDEKEQYWALDGNELIPILSQAVAATRLEELRAALQNKKVSHLDFKALGWESHYTPDQLLVELGVPVKERKLVDIALEPSSFGKAPTSLPHVKPALFSGALNTYWSHTHNLNDTEFSVSQVALRATAAIGAITVEDGHTYSYNHFTHQGHWLRDRTRLMANLPNNGGFLQFGDYEIDAQITPLPSGDLFGLSYSYQPDYIKRSDKPNLVPLSLETSALVSIRINGEDYRTLRLASGQYNLRDLPLEQGVNEVEVSYVDQSGIEQKRFFNLVDHPQLLLKGDIETQLVYGAEQIYQDDGDKEINRDNLKGQGVVSYGLTDWWTASAAMELADTAQQYSLEQNFAIGDFFFSLDGRLNEYSDSRSYNLSSQLYASELLDARLSNFSLRYGVNRSSEKDPLVHTVGISSGIKTPLDIGYLTVSLEQQFDAQQTLRQTASINTSYRINQYVTTTLNMRWQKYNDTIDRSLYFTLSFPLRWNNVSVATRTSYDSNKNQYESQVSASQYANDYYWRASTKFVDQRYDGFDGYGKIYGQRVTWNGRYSSRNLSQSTSNRTLTVGADTGFAWAGNRLLWSAPITGSFNIVSLPDAFDDAYALQYDQYRRIAVVPKEQGGQQSLLVPVKNDGYRVVKVSGDNLAFNQELKQSEFVAFGGLYSGSYHQLEIAQGFFVSGFFYNQNQQPLADVVGEFRHLQSKQSYPFFTDQLGNFELDVLPAGNYQVYFYDNVAHSIEVQVSQKQVTDDVFIDLGTIAVTKI
ncbi:hypothetical protein BIY22_03070 [Vibrio panuliri]|uniref:Pilus assembly protein PapC n=1 Tax=Vibrio panuliri TaxID=1381081 RepID=A0A1Q9HRH4_9VIBR|nr:hypothetical protein [Vibrio panuliri]OLQ93487.1 hypothetical protein BIY22_03070 [Vibrio panuliri]